MKVTIKGTVYGYVDEGRITSHVFNEFKLNAPFVKIMDHSFDIEVPEDFDFRTPAIAALRQEQQEVRAEAQSKCNLIDEQIGKLLCLEMAES